jgi:geranylgeranyl diphosphate synthase type II
MIGGQALDIDSENVALDFDSLSSLHSMKTGALLRCAARMGATCAGASEQVLAQITSFATHLGLAFQIVDDLLDVTSTPEQIGKNTRKDAARGKNTFPALLGIERARQQAHEQLEAALKTITGLGQDGCDLLTLARFVVDRKL